MWFVFTGLGCQWAKMGSDLMALDYFRETIMRLDTFMKQYDFHLYDVLVNSTDETFRNVVISLTSIVAVEVNSPRAYTVKNVRISTDILWRVFHIALWDRASLFRRFTDTDVGYMRDRFR